MSVEPAFDAHHPPRLDLVDVLRFQIGLLGLEFFQELGGVHKHGEVTASDRHNLRLRRLDRGEILAGKFGWARKVLRTLEEKDRDGEVKAEILRIERLGLRHKAFSA